MKNSGSDASEIPEANDSLGKASRKGEAPTGVVGENEETAKLLWLNKIVVVVPVESRNRVLAAEDHSFRHRRIAPPPTRDKKKNSLGSDSRCYVTLGGFDRTLAVRRSGRRGAEKKGGDKSVPGFKRKTGTEASPNSAPH